MTKRIAVCEDLSPVVWNTLFSLLERFGLSKLLLGEEILKLGKLLSGGCSFTVDDCALLSVNGKRALVVLLLEEGNFLRELLIKFRLLLVVIVEGDGFDAVL